MSLSIPDAEPSTLDDAIKATVFQLEDAFSASVASCMAIPMPSLDEFHREIEREKDHLSEETLRLARDFCTSVKVVVSSLLELDVQANMVLNGFATDLDTLLTGVSHLSLEDATETVQTEEGECSTRKRYVKAAHEWLVSNVHNPYPSREVRSRIASSNNTSQRLVDAWFVDARKRIGWNKICKAHFTSRKDMIDAATHFFRGEPIASTSAQSLGKLPSTDELAFIFISLENHARSMYSGKFSQTHEVEVAAACRGRKRSEGRDGTRPLKRKRHSRAAYPSPPASTQGTPEPAPPSRDLSQEPEGPTVTAVSNDITCQLPSPASTAGPSSPTATVTPLVTSRSSPHQPLSSKRKRNSSCEREVPNSKRARRTVSAPTAPSLEPAYNPALEALTAPFQVESVDFGVETPPSVAAVPLGENVEWDTSRFQQFVISLQREETPELSEYGFSPSVSSPGLSASPSLETIPNIEAVDFTTFSNPSSQKLLAVEPQPLIFEADYADIYGSSQDMFSSLLEPSGQYDGPLPPLNMMPNTWMQDLGQDNMNAWCLPQADKTFPGLSDPAGYQVPQLTLADGRNAKLLRAQKLREELRQLEQDIHA